MVYRRNVKADNWLDRVAAAPIKPPISDIVGRRLTAPYPKQGRKYVTYPVYLSRADRFSKPRRKKLNGERWDVPGLLSPSLCDVILNGKRYSPVSMAQAVKDLAEYYRLSNYDFGAARIKLYRPEDWSFLTSFERVRDSIVRPPLASYASAISYSPGSIDISMLNPFLCGRCGKDVRLVRHCVPLAIDPGPQRVNNEGFEVVDANPTRIELG